MSAPDYNNNLAFEPRMTFKDLCSWVKQQGYPQITVEDDIKTCESIYIGSDEYNTIELDISGIIAFNGDIITAGRTPAQMQQIIKNLFE